MALQSSVVDLYLGRFGPNGRPGLAVPLCLFHCTEQIETFRLRLNSLNATTLAYALRILMAFSSGTKYTPVPNELLILLNAF
ncbi:hypothetical protein N7523_000665 [Penicillium sp. IBT 18751x]|nr:hypothetical protein N7523_000665 [Penicillium sp. IBT 18751x]